MSAEIELPQDLQELLDRVAAEDRGAVAEALQRTLHTEADLRDATQRLEEAQRIAHFGNWEWDIRSDQVTWSDELYRIFGVKRDKFEATFEAYLELVHPHDRQRVNDEIQGALSNATRCVFEHRILLDDNTARMLRCHGEPVTDNEGKVVRLFGVCQDITELADSKRGRRSAEDRFRNAFEHAPIGVALVAIENDELGGFTAVNRAMSALTGYSEGDLVDSSLDEITVPEDRYLDSAQRRRLLAGKFDSYTVEKRFVHHEGHEVWGQFSLSLARENEEAAPYGILQMQDISERRRFEQRLRYLADHDALTGLANRRRFRGELEQQIAFYARYGGQGAVLILDVDHFKQVNDTAGHQAGDNVIREIAELLRGRARVSDAVSRLSGDEFAVLLPQTDREGAIRFAEDLRREVRLQSTATGPMPVTASVGVAMFGGETEEGGEPALISADLAMYEAKEQGRDRVVLVDEPGEVKAHSRTGLSTSARIRDALVRDRLVLYQQPIIDLRTGKAERHELLLRIQEENGELLPAGRFIQTAEQFGMVQELDRWVVGQAVSMLHKFYEEGNGEKKPKPPFGLHVNLSGSSITDAGVLEFIERSFDTTDAFPGAITFEITETAAIRNFETAAAFADRLTEFGCSIAIDDYGVGFGPFYYLKHLPFDLIKIDGDFIRDLPRNDADQLTVKAIVDIARGLGKKTIAEYVEEPATVGLLRELGVDMAQGFHLGKPIAVSEGWD
ncbi:MAG: EAL domain-containing protein [Actinomycetota bacterium]|nr:EAL domain-containing protein [Actinomycetota bacterium]